MDRRKLAIAYAYYYILLSKRQQERNLRCQKCNPPRYKVNDDDSSTYSSEYECECSSNYSTEYESESSVESEHENDFRATSVAQPGPIQSKPAISVSQPTVVHVPLTMPVGYPRLVNNQVLSKHSVIPSRSPLQVAQQNVILPHFQSQQPKMLNGRKPAQVGKQMIPPNSINQRSRQGQNNYFPVHNKLIPPAPHNPFERQMAEIEYWVRTHRPPCTYGSAMPGISSYPDRNTLDAPPTLTLPIPENKYNTITPTPAIEKTQLTFVDDDSLSSKRSPDKKQKCQQKLEMPTEKMNLKAQPKTIVDDKSSSSNKSVKHELLLPTHNCVDEIHKNENSTPESKTIARKNTLGLDISNTKNKQIFAPATSTPIKTENNFNQIEDPKPNTKNNITDFEDILKISVHESPRWSASTSIENFSKRVTRNASKRSADNLIEKLTITPQKKNNLNSARKFKQVSPIVIAGSSNSTQILRQSKEFLDDSDASVLTAPYIRSTKDNTSKSRCQTLSRQRASQTKVKSISKKSGNISQDCESERVSKKRSCDGMVDANESQNPSEDVQYSTNSSRNAMTPNVSKVSSNNSKGTSMIPKKRARMMQFTPFSTATALKKRK